MLGVPICIFLCVDSITLSDTILEQATKAYEAHWCAVAAPINARTASQTTETDAMHN